ncbi:hypothetical protein JK165_08070 [Acetobacter okinawensis]|nr:hypothetical protein [Acetobacter okinawensis]MBS0989488.1 hypothetical protein [Acetobacter okinawensis]
MSICPSSVPPGWWRINARSITKWAVVAAAVFPTATSLSDAICRRVWSGGEGDL